MAAFQILSGYSFYESKNIQVKKTTGVFKRTTEDKFFFEAFYCMLMKIDFFFPKKNYSNKPKNKTEMCRAAHYSVVLSHLTACG